VNIANERVSIPSNLFKTPHGETGRMLVQMQCAGLNITFRLLDTGVHSVTVVKSGTGL